MENKGGNGVPVTTVRITPYQEALGETPVCGVTINLRHCDIPLRTTPSSGMGVQTRTADRQALRHYSNKWVLAGARRKTSKFRVP